ncbi:MAG TPA: hypothetical protein VGB85_16585 [Nannocystis sp.]|jgi:hypothetical protein
MPPRPRQLVAYFIVGAALALLPAACICDCDTLECDAANVALELPPGQAYTVHITACIDGFDPATADELGPGSLGLWFQGEGDGAVTLAIEGLDVTPDPWAISASTEYSQALCDDGMTVILSNTGTTPVVGVLRVDVHSGDDGEACDLRLEQP